MFLNLGAPLNVAEKLVEIKRPLGSGAFGDVYKVKDKATGMKYALKHVVHQAEESEEAVKEIGHFRVPKPLTFKTRLRAKPLL